MSRNVAELKIIDNSEKILAAERKAAISILTKIGIAGKRNIQTEILKQDVYDTGETYRSTDYRVRESDLSVDVGVGTEYDIFNELGTSKRTARPHVKPGILNYANEYKSISEQELRNG